MTFEESARSSLCQLPLRPADLNSRILAARETLSKSRQALFAHFDRAFSDDESVGDWLIANIVHNAIAHAMNLLDNENPDITVAVPVTPLESALLALFGRSLGLTADEVLEKLAKAGLTGLKEAAP